MDIALILVFGLLLFVLPWLVLILCHLFLVFILVVISVVWMLVTWAVLLSAAVNLCLFRKLLLIYLIVNVGTW